MISRWTGMSTGCNSGQMVHNVALVLGGGGAAGNAWLIGIIAGLDEAGLDMTEAADLVIGTSAGATAAAQVRSGIPASWLRSTAIPASTWWTRSLRAPRCPVWRPRTASTALATSTVACAPAKTPTLPRAMRTSWCSRRWADGAGHHRNGARTWQVSSRACADHRNGVRTYQARSRACASRAPRRGTRTGLSKCHSN